ncbi:MAG: flagellar protein FliT [Gammaproteobacteria bacterium]|nr:flagellar protein FliT [Gammaproteobacteria bacterium]
MTYSNVLSEIGNCTYKMLELAQEKQWEDLAAAENNRQKLLESLSQLTPEIELVPDIEKKLNEILEINRLITLLSIQEKDNCMQDVRKMNVSKQARQAYVSY